MEQVRPVPDELKAIKIIAQDIMLRNRDPSTASEIDHVFSTYCDWRAELARLESQIDRDARLCVFASIAACRWIRSNCPNLSRGVFADFNVAHFSASMAHIPVGLRFNSTAILVPFGDLPARLDQFRLLFGSKIFIRPNAGDKSFSGFACDIDDLPHEISAIRQTQHISPSEICVIDKSRELELIEYRTWLVDGQVATYAPYSHFAPIDRRPMPASVRFAAERVASIYEDIDNAIVADFCIDQNGDAKIVEVNCFSTSGIYRAADISELVQSIDDIIL